MMETSSRDQAGGGLWNCPRGTQYSKEIQEMLKLMMQESRLTNFQQRQINDKLKKGSALPLTCNPTSSAPPSLPKPKVIKNITTRTPAKPLRRTADNCSSGDNYTRERFRPRATRDLEKEKRRLQNILATGQEEPRPSHPRNISLDQGPEEERDLFQEVLDEIEERKEFLEEMTALGKGKQYHNIINTEISQKIRELEVIDKARSAELRTIMPEKKT
uniref:Si:dkey-43k4.3 n=1 Tax=Hucho hucho TaxID=62062 RepID=A0A4W5MNY9_9TELE